MPSGIRPLVPVVFEAASITLDVFVQVNPSDDVAEKILHVLPESIPEYHMRYVEPSSITLLGKAAFVSPRPAVAPQGILPKVPVVSLLASAVLLFFVHVNPSDEYA